MPEICVIIWSVYPYQHLHRCASATPSGATLKQVRQLIWTVDKKTENTSTPIPSSYFLPGLVS